MNALMRRRRALMTRSDNGDKWDIEWSYSDGYPSVKGWTASGAGSSALQSDGLLTNDRVYTLDGVGNSIIEAKVMPINQNPTWNRPRVALRVGSSSNCGYVQFYNFGSTNKIILYNASNQNNRTTIGNFEYGTWYIIKIICMNGKYSVYINDNLAIEDVNCSTTTEKGGPLFGNISSNAACKWEYVKLKVL